MTFNSASLAVDIDGDTVTPAADSDCELYTITDTTFNLRFKWAELIDDDLEPIYDDDMFHKIHITYTATVNDDAVIGAAGNVNEANFTFDEYTPTPGETPEDPEPDPDPEYPEDPKETTTYVYSLGIFKHNAANEKLAGAKFKLYTDAACTSAVTFYNTASNAIGSYVKKIDATTPTPVAYTEFTTDSNGLIELIGLEAGTYYLKETVAPTDYNLLEDAIEIYIAEKTADKTTSNTYTESIAYEADVLNNKGTELPATGGIGTTLFITFGMIAMLSTGVFLVTNKRISKETF